MDEDLGTGSIQIVLDDSAAEASLRQLQDRIEDALDRAGRDGARRLTRAVNRAVRAFEPVRVRVEADVDALEDSLSRLDSVTVDVTPEVDRATFIAQVQAALLGAVVHINVVPNLDDFDRALRLHNAPTVHVDVDADTRGIDEATGSLNRLGGAVRSLGATVTQFGVLGGLLNDIRNLSGIAAAAPAAISGLAVAIGTLKLAASGLGEAFGAALTQSGEEFTKSLEDMTPAMAEAAKELNRLQPAFEDFQETVQSAFLEPVVDAFGDLDDTFDGLESRVEKLSGVFGNFTAEAVKVGTSRPFIDSVKTSFDAITPVLDRLSDAVEPLGLAFAQMSQSVTEAFSGQVLEAVNRFVTRIETLADSGELGERSVAWVRGAIELFQSLGAVVDSLKGIFGGLFGAAEAAGAESFTGILGTLLEVLNDLVNSDEVQGALQAMFRAFNAILPVVEAVAVAVAGLLGPAFEAVAKAILPVVEAIADAILPVMPTLVDAFDRVLEAVLPLVGVIGRALVDAINSLAPLLPVIVDALASIADAVVPLIEELIDGLVPVFNELAPVITQVVEAIAPLIPQLVDALLPVLPPLVDAFLAIVEAITPILPLIGELVAALAPMVALIFSALGPIIQFAAEIVKWVAINVVVPIIGGVVEALTSIVDGVENVVDGVTGFVEDVVGFFGNLRDRVSDIVSGLKDTVTQFFRNLGTGVAGIVSSLVTQVVGTFRAMWDRARDAVSQGIRNVLGVVRLLPGRIVQTLGGLGSRLFSAGRDMIRGFINGIKSMVKTLVQAAIDTVAAPVRAVKNFLGIGSPSRLFQQFGEWTGEGYAIGLDRMTKNVADQARGLANAAVTGFGDPTFRATTTAFSGITEPFGRSGASAFGIGTQAAAGSTVATSSQRTANVTNNFTINEVSSEATAQQVVNRLSTLLAV